MDSPRWERRGRRTLVCLLTSWVALFLAACASTPSVDTNAFKPPQEFNADSYASAEALRQFEGPSESVYRLASGDRISVNVFGRTELSGRHVVGPDGRIVIPVGGPVQVASLTSEEAASAITALLKPLYQEPLVTVGVDEFTGNRVLLLGRVENPGIVHFDTQPTLLEALARAGALPVLDKQATLTRCAVMRGRDKVMWIDLQHLLSVGDMSLNIRLQPNDLVYIPDSDETLVYVLGEVKKPGAYRLTAEMSFLDALAQAGGPTEDANQDDLHLVRPSKKSERILSMEDDIVASNPDANVALEEGDVLYVPRRGIRKLGYVLQQLSPFSTLLLLITSFGIF
jgi:polysaccharide biosynthesis/export protein